MYVNRNAPVSNETRTVVNGVEYIVKSTYNKEARETAEQKIMRLIKECVAAEIRGSTDGANCVRG